MSAAMSTNSVSTTAASSVTVTGADAVKATSTVAAPSTRVAVSKPGNAGNRDIAC